MIRLLLLLLLVAAPAAAAPAERLVLALTWHPAFCEPRPNLAECADQAEALVLHGLWPEQGGSYCGERELARLDRPSQWRRLPEIRLPKALRERLSEAMPGSRAHLDRHEWHKHGTCSGLDADGYFSEAFKLLDQARRSEVGALLAANVGRTITAGEICKALTAEFGPAALGAVRLEIDHGMLTELRFSLRRDEAGELALTPRHLDPAGRRMRCDDRPLMIDAAGSNSR